MGLSAAGQRQMKRGLIAAARYSLIHCVSDTDNSQTGREKASGESVGEPGSRNKWLLGRNGCAGCHIRPDQWRVSSGWRIEAGVLLLLTPASPVLLISVSACLEVLLLIFVGDEIEPSGFYVVASSQRCHCNVCVQIALCGGGGRVCLPLLSHNINSITLLPPVSPQLQSIHFPIFPSILIYPFYLPPVFVSSPRRLSLRVMSPGFLSPREEAEESGKRFSQEVADVTGMRWRFRVV